MPRVQHVAALLIAAALASGASPHIAGAAKLTRMEAIESALDICRQAWVERRNGGPPTRLKQYEDRIQNLLKESAPSSEDASRLTHAVLAAQPACYFIFGIRLIVGAPTGAAEMAPRLFPWPPPVPSTIYALSRTTLDHTSLPTLGKVADYLNGRLQVRGYSDSRFYRVGNDGFAIVTRLEQTDEAGHPLQGMKRWPDYEKLGWLELNQHPEVNALVRWLWFLPEQLSSPGANYRFFVFVVSPHTFRPDANLKIDVPLARRWLQEGWVRLDPELAGEQFTEKYQVTTLVYEFKVRRNDSLELEQPSRLPGKEHLLAAGIDFSSLHE